MRSAPRYLAWEMMERSFDSAQEVKALHLRSTYRSPEAAHPQSFDEFIRHHIQAFLLCLYVMPLCFLFLMAGMLSLRSGLFRFYQEKRKSPSVANRGKPERREKTAANKLI
jgi:hypothetical protein